MERCTGTLYVSSQPMQRNSVRVHYMSAVSPCNGTVYGYTTGQQSAHITEQCTGTL